MRVKVGETIYDSGIEPVMVILTAEEKADIAELDHDETMYCRFPIGMGEDEAGAWMYRAAVSRPSAMIACAPDAPSAAGNAEERLRPVHLFAGLTQRPCWSMTACDEDVPDEEVTSDPDKVTCADCRAQMNERSDNDAG
jgi:hypothetical protein